MATQIERNLTLSIAGAFVGALLRRCWRHILDAECTGWRAAKLRTAQNGLQRRQAACARLEMTS